MRKRVYFLLIGLFLFNACQPAPSSAGNPSPKTPLKETLIPAGSFTMGSDFGFPDEQPVHQVPLEAYYIDTYEVTNAHYAECVATSKCDAPAGSDSVTHGSYYGNAEFDNYPVIAVSWFNAESYCAWRGARLPTEVEWERAARGPQPRSYPWGEGIDKTFANYNTFVGDTTAVGSYESGKSVEGVYDLAGNVWEWVADWYNIYPGGDPAASSDFGEKYRVMRGGGWQDLADSVSATSRGWDEASFVNYHVGFRCARTP